MMKKEENDSVRKNINRTEEAIVKIKTSLKVF